MSASRSERIENLQKRISRLDRLIVLLSSCDDGRRRWLCELAEEVNVGDTLDLVDDLAERLDDMIEPGNPVLEWISDAGIRLVARLAAEIWVNRHVHLEARRDRLARKLRRLQRLEARS